MISSRRVPRPKLGSDTTAPAPPAPPLSTEIIYKGYRVEPGSYSVGGSAWSPRVVVSTKTETGAWRPMPLYATSSVRFLSRDLADRRALEVATEWIDATVARERKKG